MAIAGHVLSTAWEDLREPKSHEIVIYMFVSKEIPNNDVVYWIYWESTMIMCIIQLYDGVSLLGIILETTMEILMRLIGSPFGDLILGQHGLLPINIALMRQLTLPK